MIRTLVVMALSTFVGMAQQAAAQDAVAGQTVFKKCQSCHMVGDDAKNRVGPVLTGVVGRQAGTFEGYKYGKSMVQAGEAGLIWDPEKLFDYLADPRTFLRTYLDDKKAKAKMSFRLKDEQSRRDVIAYLATFSSEATEKQSSLKSEGLLETAKNTLCVRNQNSHKHFFAVEAANAERLTGFLEPGEVLCTKAEPGLTGVVSVFEKADALEGCSRLVPVGTTEDMLKYVDFDRCFWSSNT